MKSYKSILIAVLALAVIAGLVIYFTKNRNQNTAQNIDSYQDCIEAGNPSLESYPAQCKTKDGNSYTEDVGNEIDLSSEIRSDSPRPNQVITSSIELRGQAVGGWYFEASFSAKLIDANGKQLAEIPVTAQGEWMTSSFVPYKGTLNFAKPTTATGTLILEKANASGLPANDKSLRIPVRFSNASADSTTTVKVFFSNSKMNAECEKTVPINREVPQTTAIARSAITELLKGLTASEKTNGYTTLINEGVKLNSLTIENGVAMIDFSAELENNSGGACRANGIRSQIAETLKQFPTVKDVKISVNGNAQVLQP